VKGFVEKRRGECGREEEQRDPLPGMASTGSTRRGFHGSSLRSKVGVYTPLRQSEGDPAPHSLRFTHSMISSPPSMYS
jgi:hypothetical protein